MQLRRLGSRAVAFVCLTVVIFLHAGAAMSARPDQINRPVMYRYLLPLFAEGQSAEVKTKSMFAEHTHTHRLLFLKRPAAPPLHHWDGVRLPVTSALTHMAVSQSQDTLG